MEQQPPPTPKFEDAKSYSHTTSGRCRTAIHTCTHYLLATVLLAWSFRKPRLFKAWLVSTTKHFLSLPMWKTRYFSQKEHGTQWATRLLSAAFGALTVVTGVTVCFLNGHYVAGAASATACASWYVHGARMRQLGLVGEADDKKWTEKGAVLQKLDYLWMVVVRPTQEGHEATPQPFTVATLIIFAYNIVLGTTSLYLVLVNTGAVIAWANCLWGFLSLFLLQAGLLTGAFAAICDVAFNDDFDRLMKAAVAGYEKVSAVDEAIRIGMRRVDDAEREGDVIPLLIDVLRDDVNAVLGAKSLPLVPASLVTASAIMGRLNFTRREALASYEDARCAVVSYLTGNEDGRIVFTAAPTGRLADIAACYDRELADDAKDKELGGIACQFAAKVKFLRRYLGKRVGNQGGSTRQGGLKDNETLVMVVQTNACTEDGFKKGESTCSTKQNPSGLIKIELGRDAELLSNRFLKGRPTMRSQLAAVYAFVRARMWWKFGENPTNADELDDLDINTVGVQQYVITFFDEPHQWEVQASQKSQGLAMGVGMRVRHGVEGAFVRSRRDVALFDGVEVAARIARQPTPHRSTSAQWWYKCPDDKTWTCVDRGKDANYWKTFAMPTDADLDAAMPYKELTINGEPDGPKFAPIWEERLDDDDENDDGTWEDSRDASRATRPATALATVAAWNLEKEGSPPVFSIALDDGSGDRRCARVAFSSELAANSMKNTADTDEYGPIVDALAEAGGVVVDLDDRRGLSADLLVVGRGVKFSGRGALVTTLKLDARVVSGNWQNSEWGAESYPGTKGSLFVVDAVGSLARTRPTRGASRVATPAAATPAAPTESAADLAGAPCFVLDALNAGRPVFDDAAKQFREHYACFERRRMDPNERPKRPGLPTPWDLYHEEHGEFYPTDYRGKGGGFNDLPPPKASYA